MKRIRVAHIINSMEIGGAQRQVVNLFRAIDPHKFELRLICLAHKGEFGEALERDGFEVRALGKGSRVQFGMLFRLARLLREWKPDIVHCSVFTANLWGRLAAKEAGVPVCIAHEQSTVSLEKWYRRAIDRILSWGTHRILVVSDDLRRRVIAEEGIAARRVEVLYNGIDCGAVERYAGREFSDLPGTPGLRVGIVGRLEYRKDHLTLIRAAAHVAKTMPAVMFMIVGEGPDRPQLEAEIERLGVGAQVRLMGQRDDVAALLHAFDVYVLSSITEGLSLSILEAMAAERPIVATRVGGNSELLDDGRAGLLVEAGDVDGMATAMERLLRNREEAQQLGQAAHRRVRELFDIAAVARKLEGIYGRSVS